MKQLADAMNINMNDPAATGAGSACSSGKVLIGGIQKFSTDDGPGIRTTVFLKGCPLHCLWCHNPELISFSQEVIRMPNSCIHCGCCIAACPSGALYVDDTGEIDLHKDRCTVCLKCVDTCYAEGLKAVGTEMSVAEVMEQIVQDKGFYDQTGGGMTISGGELLSHAVFAAKLIDLAAAENINVCLDTSGYGRVEDLLSLAVRPNVTDILYDMKCLDREEHQQLAGVDNSLILQNLRTLAEDSVIRQKIHMRMPLIHGLNDDEALIHRTAAFYRELRLQKVTLLPYHRLGVSKARHIGSSQESYEAPAPDYTELLRQIFENEAHMQAEVSGIARH